MAKNIEDDEELMRFLGTRCIDYLGTTPGKELVKQAAKQLAIDIDNQIMEEALENTNLNK